MGKAKTVGALVKTGMLKPIRPDRLMRMAKEAKKWGSSPAAAVAMSAQRYPKRKAIIDAKGTLTWGELDRRTNNAARALRDAGIDADSVMGIMCRNHRGFVEALVTAGKVGSDAVLLNTGFSGPQLGEVARREGVTFLVHDESFASEVAESGLADEIPCYRAWTQGAGGEGPSFEDLCDQGSGDAVHAPDSHSAVVILSSGTTGTPKGAKRSIDRDKAKASMAANIGVMTRIPVRSGEKTLISAPLFHTWGLTNLLVASLMSAPMVLRERFDPADVVETMAREKVGTFVAVPAMLQRILDAVPEDERRRHDTSKLRVVALSGSALPGGLATRWMDAFGDNIYSLYGSTEVAAVAIADPSDLRAAPDTAGPPLEAIQVRLLDADGNEVEPGESGRIFVRSGMLFDGYTSGGSKEVIDGYMSTGDLGHFDDAGRLYVDGREDDMIISGGENVYPQEVEEVILQNDSIDDAVVFGVPDDKFGQRLVAVVVAASGTEPTEDEIKAWVKSNLANYKVPRQVIFRDELPRNPTGKLLRRVLVDEVADQP